MILDSQRISSSGQVSIPPKLDAAAGVCRPLSSLDFFFSLFPFSCGDFRHGVVSVEVLSRLFSFCCGQGREAGALRVLTFDG